MEGEGVLCVPVGQSVALGFVVVLYLELCLALRLPHSIRTFDGYYWGGPEVVGCRDWPGQ